MKGQKRDAAVRRKYTDGGLTVSLVYGEAHVSRKIRVLRACVSRY